MAKKKQLTIWQVVVVDDAAERILSDDKVYAFNEKDALNKAAAGHPGAAAFPNRKVFARPWEVGPRSASKNASSKKKDGNDKGKNKK